LGILDSFERSLERAVNGAFAKTFKSGLQPLEITAALRKELDTKAAVVSRDRILAPNNFTVQLSPSDYARMTSLGPALIGELTGLVKKHAKSQGYQFSGAVTIALREDPSLTDGLLQVDSDSAQGHVTWHPALDIAGKRYPLTSSRTIIGRGHDADITVDDTGTSRKHVEILWDGNRAQVNDLGSTNGTTLNGQKVSKALLQPDAVVQIGRTQITYRLLPQNSKADQLADVAGDRPTRGDDLGNFWAGR